MNLEPLLAEVVRHPDADAARGVYADALLQEGDPRGELIALQLAAHPDHDRIEALVEQHGVEWLGSLRDVTKRAQFRRGFVTRLELLERSRPTVEQLADPALGTVEDLLPGSAHHDLYAKFITSRAMTALRRIDVYNDQLVTALAKTPARITHIACAANASDGEPPAWLVRMLEICDRRPEVTSLTCKLWMLRFVAQSPLFERLTSLAISKRVSESIQSWPVHGRRIPLSVQAMPALEPCIAGPESWLGAVEVVPTENGAVLRAWGDFGLRAISAAMQYVAADVKRIELEGAPEDLERVERLAARFKLELVVKPARPRVGYVRARAIRPKV